MKRKALLILIFFLLATLLPHSGEPSKAAPQSKQDARPPRAWIAPRGGQPFFVVGANYEGATDRAWRMWEKDLFDPKLIEGDFDRARALGINTLRIFIQRPLRDDINSGDFSKLNSVVEIARRYNLFLIVTFTDWPEPDVARAGRLNAAIASHLTNEPQILAYDAKNEPQFTDVAGAIYPSTTLTVPLQSPALIAHYGERIPRQSIGEYRRSTEGRAVIPTRMTDEQAYAIGNYYKIYLEFLTAGAEWVGSHSGTTTIDYMGHPDSAQWQPFLAGLDATLQAWVNAQIDPVRGVDPNRPLTVGYSNMVLARLPSNRTLSFHSIHRYAAHGASGLNATFRVLDGLQRAFPTQPVMLEEFGYPGQVKDSNGGVVGFDPRTNANLESAVWAYLYANGFAGGAKWMLNNFTEGHDPAQNTYGLFDNANQPKHSAHALQHITTLFSRTPPGAISSVRTDSNSSANYSYSAQGALIAGGKTYTATGIIYEATAPSQFVLGNTSGTVTLFSTDTSTATLTLSELFTLPHSEIARVTLVAVDPQGRSAAPPAMTRTGDTLRINLQPLFSYRLTITPRALLRAQPILDPNSTYFSQTGHNLSGEFLRYWQLKGGLAIYGYPLTEEFTENGKTVQYFERNRFEYHPQNTPPYNVLLGRLGADLTKGRTFDPVKAFVSEPGHRYFPETGHSLHHAFLGYWDRKGGLAQFGYPISEEIKEKSLTDGKEYTVQYFERARMEYHPEFRGTDAEVLLGLLGVTAIQTKGWGR